jgi:hypothetical protein
MSFENSIVCSAIIQTGFNKGKLCNRKNCTYKSHNFSSLERKVTDLENKCKINQEVLYQLIGGLFNHTTQADILDYNVNSLFDTPHVGEITGNIWPTTRQGDKNEDRINLLEKEVGKLRNKCKDCKDCGKNAYPTRCFQCVKKYTGICPDCGEYYRKMSDKGKKFKNCLNCFGKEKI